MLVNHYPDCKLYQTYGVKILVRLLVRNLDRYILL
jgi:hypothetical protein